jgi:hypothetical protein
MVDIIDLEERRAAAESRKPGGIDLAGGVTRRSYCILPAAEQAPSLELKSRRGQTRLFPWLYFAGAALDHPGELILLFDGPEGSSRIALFGRGLDQELKEGIKTQRVSLICELEELSAAAATKAGEPVVTGIAIDGGGREWTGGFGETR